MKRPEVKVRSYMGSGMGSLTFDFNQRLVHLHTTFDSLILFMGKVYRQFKSAR